MFRFFEGVYAIGSSLFIKPLDLLVISDLQIGYEEQLRGSGSLIIDSDLSGFKRRIMRSLEESGAKRLLIDGDIKHEFGRINDQERMIRTFFDFLKGYETIFVKGNHDLLLEPLVGLLHDSYNEGGFFFCHGHEIIEPPGNVRTIIIGHEHPAVRLSDGIRHEWAKCFLVGKWRGFNLIVLPSFSELTIGSNIISYKFLSPYLEKKEKFTAYAIVENSVFRFGTVDSIRAAFK